MAFWSFISRDFANSADVLPITVGRGSYQFLSTDLFVIRHCNPRSPRGGGIWT